VTRTELVPTPGLGSAPSGRALAPYRLMVVDDSAAIRGLLIRTLEADSEVAVVASASNGAVALAALARYDVEVVILDIEMPVMDGLTALPKLLAAKPGIKVIIASTLTRRGAEISVRALAAGAADYLTKPGSLVLSSADQFKRELLAKVKVLGHASRVSVALRSARRIPGPRRPADAVAPGELPRRVIALRPAAREIPEAIAIGSSTGGPQALFSMLGALKGAVRQPIFITQHMPATFTTILAEHISRTSGYPTREAVDGELVTPGHIYLAPGDFHMAVETMAPGSRVMRLSKAAPENFCRPSVDPMLRSLAASYGPRVLCIMLTGMGRDGLAGSRTVVQTGGTVIAQDEATSIVWGMPGAVAMAGLCSAVLPLADISATVEKLASRGRP
jgi:two-component system, chemotaxis family, protein-glutamate methylesterase/glutaminase